ncbi:hypothetical protein BBF96_10545 [Anoxybacter fermentans]|uniref:Glycosyl transferase n=1 Tax=Anoxybacter fermentans TaxID=1323375 RepID=A0A3S9SZL5_9FIRM|nr:glycosyltransferase family 1 protein [Anoxybacter fermentans]AZR73786.1 hypothetical protein BBF96_10545 [Anoxybacter fermentans]
MKIGIDGRAAKWYRGTGIGTYTYQLLKNLKLVDASNEYYFFWPGDDYDFLQRGPLIKVEEISHKKDLFWEEVHIPIRLSEERIEIYHVPQNGIGLPRCKESKYVVTIHDLIPYTMPETVGKGYLRIFLNQVPRIMEEADLIITVSEYSKKDIIRYFNLTPDRIVVTHLAPEDFYRPLPSDQLKPFLKKYNLLPGYILYVGGFSHRKNIKAIIRAFALIKDQLPENYRLVIAGSPGRSYEDLMKLIRQKGLEERVDLPGFIPVKEMVYLYNAAKLFVYPSYYEGFGLPPLEAMACGIPVITSNVTSIPEVVGDGAETVNPSDEVSLAELMYRVLSDREFWFDLHKRGMKRVAQFDWRKTAAQTLQAYYKLYQSECM